MSMSVIDQYNQKHKDDEFLGKIAWFSVREMFVPHHIVETELTQLGLGEWAPRKPADSDVWRKVTTAAQRSRVQGPNGQVFNVLVRQVDDNEHEILRRVVIETVDAKHGKRLSYDECYDVAFDRQTARCVERKLTDKDFGGLDDDVASEICRTYGQQRGCVDANAVRTTINRVLQKNNATLVRPTGGVLFVPRATADAVSKLELFASRIPGADVHSLPLIDDPKQRELVKTGIQSEVSREVDELLAEIRDAQSADGKSRERKTTTLITRSTQLHTKLETFAELLDDELAMAKGRLEVLALQMRGLIKAAA